MYKVALFGTAALLLLLAQLRLAHAQAAAAAADNNKCPLRSEDLKYWDWTPLRTACGKHCFHHGWPAKRHRVQLHVCSPDLQAPATTCHPATHGQLCAAMYVCRAGLSSRDFCTSCACAVATTTLSGFDRAGVLINSLRLRELKDETFRAVMDSCSSILTVEVSEVTDCRLLCCAGLLPGCEYVLEYDAVLLCL